MVTKNKPRARKLTKRRFVLNAIHALRKSGYLGIHVVYSGFNKAFRDYYRQDPIAEVDKLVEKGVIIKQPVRGGVMLYDHKEYKQKGSSFFGKPKSNSSEVLRKIIKS